MKKLIDGFNLYEIILWGISVNAITVSFLIFGGASILNFTASLIGVTSLIFCAKGDAAGQALMIVFSLLYGLISYYTKYYGEMITYMGMTMPMAMFSLISWIRHPYKGCERQVEINSIKKTEYIFLCFLAILVTFIFYYVLKALGTASLFFSTISVTTSFCAAYLTFRRCRAYALFYAMNDVVLIILWCIACTQDSRYISVVICFLMFLVNDIYGFYSWGRMKDRQKG